MKKNIVLFALFILPIVAYLFFASGVNTFIKLPVVTEKVDDLGDWTGLRGEAFTLDGKITVLGFGGHDLLKNRGNIYNLYQKIFRTYHGFRDLQFVYVCPKGTEKDAKYIIDQLDDTSDVSNFHFVFASDEDIQDFYNGLKLRGKLNADLGSRNVMMIDKDRKLRGRIGDEYRESYDTFHPSVISNEFLDDFKILLYEYRAAFKRNNISKNEK